MTTESQMPGSVAPLPDADRAGSKVTILAAVDLSPESDKVIAAVQVVAARCEARVILLHCMDPDADMVRFSGGSPETRAVIAGELRHDHSLIQDYADRLRLAGIDAIALLVREEPVEGTLKRARRDHASLIVMGCHGHGAAYDMIVGSTATAMLHDSEIPIMFVPTRDAWPDG